VASWWIADPEGRVLGPVSLEVVQQLWAARRLSPASRLSSDAKHFVPLEAVPQVFDAATKEAADARAARERREAELLTRKLQDLRSRPAHEVLGVAADASLEIFREAFFKVVKPYHPERLPEGSDPALGVAHQLAFRFYSSLMARLDNGLARAAVPASPPRAIPQLSPQAPPIASAPTPPSPPRAQVATPARARPAAPAATSSEERYRPDAFLGFKALPWGNFQTEIKVTSGNVGMFTDHPVMNLKMNGIFLSCEERLPMGSYVDLKFDFGDAQVETRGKVALESSAGKNRGLGISLFNLDARSRERLQQLVLALSLQAR
jgi:hypothetical protein